MRAIKFRGKSKVTDEWVYGYLVKRGSEWFIDNETTDWNSMTPLGKIEYHKIKIKGNTKGQYTGLRDKNNKEIYEGDIVKYFYDTPSVVEFVQGAFKLKRDCCFDTFSYLEGEVEVIGNIYENPELLEVKEL